MIEQKKRFNVYVGVPAFTDRYFRKLLASFDELEDAELFAFDQVHEEFTPGKTLITWCQIVDTTVTHNNGIVSSIERGTVDGVTL